MTLIGFTGLLVTAPVVVGALTDLDAIEHRRVTWGLVLGAGIGLVTAAVAVLVVCTEIFRTKPDVFIYAVDRIHERLARRYGRSHVFRDSDSVPAGQHVQNVTELTWAPYDDLIAVTGIDMELSVWRLTSDHLERQNQYEPAAVARWSPDGTKLAIADSLSEDVHVLGSDGEPTTTLATGLYGVEELYWSPDIEHLAATTVNQPGAGMAVGRPHGRPVPFDQALGTDRSRRLHLAGVVSGQHQRGRRRGRAAAGPFRRRDTEGTARPGPGRRGGALDDRRHPGCLRTAGPHLVPGLLVS